jgi:hypothetical protein
LVFVVLSFLLDFPPISYLRSSPPAFVPHQQLGKISTRNFTELSMTFQRELRCRNGNLYPRLNNNIFRLCAVSHTSLVHLAKIHLYCLISQCSESQVVSPSILLDICSSKWRSKGNCVDLDGVRSVLEPITLAEVVALLRWSSLKLSWVFWVPPATYWSSIIKLVHDPVLPRPIQFGVH